MRIFNKISDATIPTPPAGKKTLYCDAVGVLSLKDESANVHKFNNSLIEINYAELLTAITNNLLVPGSKYLLTDYQTVHIIPGTEDVNTGPIEPLIITAAGTNLIEPVAYSTLYPQDIIYYSVVPNEEECPGSTHGYIMRRIDTLKNNNIGTDWRHVKYRRYKISQPNWTAETIYSKFDAVKRSSGNAAQQNWIYISLKDDNINHPVTDTVWWKRFEFNNNTYSGMTPDGWWVINDEDEGYTACNIVTTAEYEDKLLCPGDMQNNYVAGDMLYNTTIDNLNNTEIYGFFQDNTLYSLYSSVIRGEFRKNSCGSINYCNISGNNFSFNSIGAWFDNNSVMCANFVYNIIGTTFQFNELTNSGVSFVQNVINSDFSQNLITTSFFDNNVSYGFAFNRIFGQFSGNNISGNFQANLLYSDFIDCTSVGLNVKNNIFQYKQFTGYNLPEGLNKTTNGTKVYRALLSQTGTDDPVATVLENTLGVSVTWTRKAEGYYVGAIFAPTIGANIDNTFVICSNTDNGSTDTISIQAAFYLEDGGIYLSSRKNGVLSDNVLSREDGWIRTSIEIKIYI